MSKVCDLLDGCDAGKLTRAEMLERLASLDYRLIEPAVQTPDGATDFPQTGTLEEVETATVADRLTDDEFEVVVMNVLTRQPQLDGLV